MFGKSDSLKSLGLFVPWSFGPLVYYPTVMTEKKEPHRFSKIAEELVCDLRGVPSDEPKRSKKRPTQSLATVVEQLLEKHHLGRESAEHTIRDQWKAIVGDANAGYSHPATIERNLLIVLAGHAVVRNELFLHRSEIAERIRKLPGCGHVKGINLRAG